MADCGARGSLVASEGACSQCYFSGLSYADGDTGFFFFSRKNYFCPIERRFLLGMAVFSLIILILTQTRGAWIAFVLVMIAYILLERRFRRQLLLGGAIGVLCIAGVMLLSSNYSQRLATITNPQMQSNLERTYMWRAAVSMWEEHPVTGVGMDEYGWYYNTIYIPSEAKERPVVEGRPDTGHGHPRFSGRAS